MNRRVYRLAAFAMLAAAALFARAVAAPGTATVTLAGGVLTFASASNQSVIFHYQPQCGDDAKPCYSFFAADNGEPATIDAGSCRTVTAGTVECPADGVSKIEVTMGPSGTFAYNDGSHHVRPCSPASLSVQTGPEIANVDVWNGCHETIVCLPKTSVAAVVADAGDEVKGKCFGVERH